MKRRGPAKAGAAPGGWAIYYPRKPSPRPCPGRPGRDARSTFYATRPTTFRAKPTPIVAPTTCGVRSAQKRKRYRVPQCFTELRWLDDRRDAAGARLQLRAWIEKWATEHPKLCAWVEESIGETWTFYRSPREHHKHLKSTNLLERLDQKLKRRTHVVRIFPNDASGLRLIRGLACEPHEGWLDGPVYLDLQPLREALKPSLQLAA